MGEGRGPVRARTPLLAQETHVKHERRRDGALHANGDNGARQHDGDGVVQHALAKDEHVERLVNVQRLEDGQRGDRVDGRDERAKDEA